MVISTKRFESRNCSYHRRFSTTSRSIRCCGECRRLINSVLHRNPMVFWPELIKRRHCSYHCQHACCAERRRLINSHLHRKQMSFTPELIKSQCSPLHLTLSGTALQGDSRLAEPQYLYHVVFSTGHRYIYYYV
jgi:hypothetical protein